MSRKISVIDREKVSYSHKIRRIRLNLKKKQREFADDLGFSTSYISDIERGISNPSRNFLSQLRTVYGVSVDELLPTPKDMTKIVPIDPYAQVVAEVLAERPHIKMSQAKRAKLARQVRRLVEGLIEEEIEESKGGASHGKEKKRKRG